MAAARRRPETTVYGGELHRVACKCVQLDALAALRGKPDPIVDDDAALARLLRNGNEPAAELTECAERARLW